MPRLMYDSTTPWDIPRDAKLIAYYVDGLYAWPEHWFAMFPEAEFVSISAIGARTAEVGDVEVGCIWPPAKAVPWTVRSRQDGHTPTIYCNELNDWLAVRQAFWAAGVEEPLYWVARYNGVREIPAGSVGRQFAHPHDGDGVADRPWETGGHFDLSWMADNWPPGTPHAPGGGGTHDGGEDDDMFTKGRELPASVAPRYTPINFPAVGMSEALPEGPETNAWVDIFVPHEDMKIWALWAIVTKGVNTGRSEARLLAGPGRAPSSETGEPPVDLDAATLGYDTYVTYELPIGTHAVTVLHSGAVEGAISITGSKTRKVSAK
jgi:hypothetical protein